MGLNVWTLFLALGNATVNTSLPSALGRVKSQHLPSSSEHQHSASVLRALTCTEFTLQGNPDSL